MSPLDLALVKLQLGREKDIDLLKSLIKAGLVTIAALRKAYQETAMNERTMFKAGRTLCQLEAEVGGGGLGLPSTLLLCANPGLGYGRARKRSAGPAGKK